MLGTKYGLNFPTSSNLGYHLYSTYIYTLYIIHTVFNYFLRY